VICSNWCWERAANSPEARGYSTGGEASEPSGGGGRGGGWGSNRRQSAAVGVDVGGTGVAAGGSVGRAPGGADGATGAWGVGSGDGDAGGVGVAVGVAGGGSVGVGVAAAGGLWGTPLRPEGAEAGRGSARTWSSPRRMVGTTGMVGVGVGEAAVSPSGEEVGVGDATSTVGVDTSVWPGGGDSAPPMVDW
jgi:hypothetical protein